MRLLRRFAPRNDGVVWGMATRNDSGEGDASRNDCVVWGMATRNDSGEGGAPRNDGKVQSSFISGCHCERSEAIRLGITTGYYEIASSLRSSQ